MAKKIQLVGTLKTPQSDWAQTDETQLDYIKNKPDMNKKMPYITVATEPSTTLQAVRDAIEEATGDESIFCIVMLTGYLSKNTAFRFRELGSIYEVYSFDFSTLNSRTDYAYIDQVTLSSFLNSPPNNAVIYQPKTDEALETADKTITGAINEVNKNTNKIATTTGTGEAYEVDIPGISELVVGMSFTMIPHTENTVVGVTLNVNGLGAIGIRRSGGFASTLSYVSVGGFSAGIPVEMMYDGTWWRAVSLHKTLASDLDGILPISKGGTGASTAEEARANLGITAAMPTLNTSLGKSSAASELASFLRKNGITASDRCIIHCTLSGTEYFSDSLVKIGNPFSSGTMVTVEWTELHNPIRYYANVSVSTTIGDIITNKNNMLGTYDKTIVGAINELNSWISENSSSILEQTGLIATTSDDASIEETNETGIFVLDTLKFLDEDAEDVLSSKILSHRLPIAEGDNITFTTDTNNNVVKINATSSLPPCDSTNEGQFLRVVVQDGVVSPVWSTIPNAEDNTF